MPCRDVRWSLSMIKENGKLAIFLFPLFLFLYLLYIDVSTFQSFGCPGPLLETHLVLRDLGSSLLGTTVCKEQGVQRVNKWQTDPSHINYDLLDFFSIFNKRWSVNKMSEEAKIQTLSGYSHDLPNQKAWSINIDHHHHHHHQAI